MKAILKDFSGYLYNHRFVYLFAAALYILVYLLWMTDFTAGVDTEHLINDVYFQTNEWKGSGRWGLVLSMKIFGLYRFNPNFYINLGFFFFFAFGVLFGYSMYYFAGVRAEFGGVFTILFLINPVMVFQFYFQNQIMILGLAFIFACLGVFLAYYSFFAKSKLCGLLALGFTTWAVASYQSVNFVYIGLAVLLFLMIMLSEKTYKDKSGAPIRYGLLALYQGGIYVVSFLIYWIVKVLRFPSSGYIDGFVRWKTASVSEILSSLKIYFYEVFSGGRIYYSRMFTLILVLALVGYIYIIIKNKEKYRALSIVAIFGFDLTAFMLAFVMGQAPTIRAELGYVFVMAGNAVLLGVICNKKNLFRVFYIIIIAFTLCKFANLSSRLVYTDYERKKWDVAVTREIFNEVAVINPERKPVYVVGAKRPDYSNAQLVEDIIGYSAYSWFYNSVPVYWESSERVVGLAKTLGYNYEVIPKDEARMNNCRMVAKDMPVWPLEGSIKDNGQEIIIKVGNDDLLER